MSLKYLLHLLLLIFITRQCSDCVELSFHTCWVCYEDCENGLIFHNCTQQICGAYYVNAQGEQSCSYYINVTHAAQDCFSECCSDEMQTANFSVDGLNQCKEYNDASTIALIASLSSVFGVAILIVIICACLGFKCPCSNQDQNNDPQAPNRTEQTFNGPILVNSYEWRRDIAPCSGIQNRFYKCSICHFNNVDTIMKCDHVYHLQCIIESLHRNQICPLCDKKQFNPARFYCQRCFTGYSEFNLSYDSNYYEITSKLKGDKCPTCSS